MFGYQSYREAVSYRAMELTASELVSALDGISKYQPGPPSPRVGTASWSLSPPSRTPAAAASRAVSRPSATRWTDRILSALVCPLWQIPQGSGNSSSHSDSVLEVATSSKGGDYTSNCSVWSAPSSSFRPGSGGSNSSAGISSDRGGGGGVLQSSPVSEWVGGPPRMERLEPGEAVSLAHLLVQLDVRPSPRWMAAFLHSTAVLVPRLENTQLIRLLELLADLGATPDFAWWGTVLDRWPPEPGPWRAGSAAMIPHGSGGGGTDMLAPSYAEDSSALDARSAVLYGMLVCGLPRGPGGVALAAGLSGWADAALYDLARGALLSGQLARDVGGWQASACDGTTTQAAEGAERSGASGGEPAAAAVASQCYGGEGLATRPLPPPPPPSARAVAKALAALPAVMPHSPRHWVSEPAGELCGAAAAAAGMRGRNPSP
jgi:hypothetical protein